jgi:hypothetical protein
MMLLSSLADARITRLEVVRTKSPTFEGRSFGDVGTYEKIIARAYGEVDPQDAHNSVITDIALAPQNERGMVEYSTDVHILKPVDMSKGNGKIFYDVVNRGNKIALGSFNDAPSSNDPTTAAHAGSGLLMRLGYTVVWSGWESSDIIGTAGMTASLPVARNPDGSSIVGQTIFEQIFDNTTGIQFPLVYRAATLDQTQATMTVRNASEGPLATRVTVPTSVWSYVNNRTVQINRSDPFLVSYDAGAAYELIYPAEDPIVLGLGYGATRDIVSFLRHDASAENPLHSAIWYALAHGSSQSGRYLKGFTHLGFNQDEAGRMVFEGINPHISGAHAIAANDRFGDNNATGRKYQRHTIAKMEFPFTYEVRTDPVSGLTDGIFARCELTGTCPKVIHTDSANEAYLKPLALVTTDGLGNDIELPADVRVFLIGSTQHGPAAVPSFGICQQLSNPNDYRPYLRALFVALDAWATEGVRPPRSRYPKVSDGTLVPTLPQSTLGFPVIPGVNYTGWINPVAVLDKTSLPYTPIPGKDYVVLAPRTDADGNDLAGVRTVEVQAPLATYTGWALRRAGFAEGEDCGLQGQYIPFATTRAERLEAGDPRLSIEERYRTHAQYVRRVERAAKRLVKQRLLLEEDAERLIQEAENSNVLR